MIQARSHHHPPPGVALVMTLGILALISLLVISFLALSTSESRSADSFAQSRGARRLADSAVHLVMAQIREGTEGFARSSGGGIDPGQPLAWVSQPGMIHTFRQSGAPDRVFRLYSSETMIEAAGATPPNDVAALADWHDRPGIFTDLNSPVMVPDGSGGFTPQTPIVAVADLVQGSTLNPLVPGWTYSRDGITADIEGFHVTPPPSYRPGDPVAPDNNPIPMPVRWLYLLEDGQLTAPRFDPATDEAVFDLSGQVIPTAANPIVGRIAFWTDDETGKININTASEGTYWDLPRIWSQEDIGKYTGNDILTTPGLAFGQPAQKEFQRYAGHPATTSLSPVLGSVLPRPDTINTTTATDFESYYQLTPRTNIGGSRSGTQIVRAPIPIKNDRLYPSVDDFLFAARISDGRTRNTPLTPDLIRKSKFFLSAHSIAPETTLFNTPRMAIWPVWENAANRTAYDKLAAFCSTIGGQSYHLTRSDPRSTTADAAGRNLELYQWLSNLTSRPVPGYGGDFATKLDTDHPQVLTYIFDYIRSTNPQDRSAGAVPFTPIYNSVNRATPGAGEIIPLRIGDTQGFGRYPALSSPGIMFVTIPDPDRPGTPGDPNDPPGFLMEAIFVAEFATPAHGMACMRSGMRWRVRGLNQLRVKFGTDPWRDLKLPVSGTNLFEQGDLDHWGGRGIGGTLSLLTTIRANARTNKGLNQSGGDDIPLNYPFFSEEPVPIPTVDTQGEPKNFQFEGGHEIVLELLTETDEIVQTSRFVFPEGEFKIPTFVQDFRSRNKWWVHSTMRGQDTIIGLEVAGVSGNAATPDPDPTAGDKRMISGLHEVAPSKFRPHQNYTTVGISHAHSFTLTTGPNGCAGNTSGKLVPVPHYVSHGYNRNPDVPPRVGQDRNNNGVIDPNESFVTRIDGAPGEWDTGFGDQPDGAYINKPNDGDSAYDNRQGGGRYRPPYILGYNQGFAAARNEFFSPNLQVPSPLMFGSLPTGVKRNRPWETLLFHPRPEDPGHPGRTSPQDHLLADLFWMPVIEPYAISQPFATAGKVNLNHRIQPFDYIRRETGLHALLKSTRMLALQPIDATRYKPLDPAGRNTPFGTDRRQEIDPALTLAEFDARYASRGVFRTASEICEMHLIPPGESASSMAAFWQTHSLTGDNVREKPYVDLYPRLTTRSNSFRIHYKVQTVKLAPGADPARWKESRDSVVAEHRGATVIERLIDPNDPRLPDFATVSHTDPDAVMDRYYRFRVLSAETFQP